MDGRLAYTRQFACCQVEQRLHSMQWHHYPPVAPPLPTAQLLLLWCCPHKHLLLQRRLAHTGPRAAPCA